MEALFTKRNTVIFIGLLTLWRVFLAATLELHPDEAYYWLWSRHLDLGYYDHSPLVAYFIRLTTLVSQGELWVRFSAIAVSLVVSVLAWALSMQLFASAPVAAGAVLLLNVYPLTMSGALIITPDVPSFLFWALAVYFAWQVARTGRPAAWYLVGISFGLALLSKYTAVLFAPCLLLFLLLTDERKWLATVHPYLSFLAGLLFFLPVVLWNTRHDWISFRFQLGHGLGGEAYSLGKVIEYFGGQMLVAGPFAWLLGMTAVTVFLFRREKAGRFVSLLSLPVILFFAASSFKAVAGPNWPAFAYFTFSIAASAFFLSGPRLRKAVFTVSLAATFALSLLATLHARFGVLPLERFSKEWAKADATNWFYGWKALAGAIEARPEVRFVITPSHQLSAEIIYYTREKIAAHVDPEITRPSQFNLWPFPGRLRDAQGLYVYFGGEIPGPYQTYFSSTGTPSSLDVYRNDFRIRSYEIVPASGYLPR